MSTLCATAAPTRHPPGEAHAAPAALHLTTRVAQVAAPSGYLGGAAARGSIASSPIEESLSLPSPRDTTTGDAATPTRSTTSAFCRQKRSRRHHATRDGTLPTPLNVTIAADSCSCRSNRQPPCLPKTIGTLGRHGRLGKSADFSAPPPPESAKNYWPTRHARSNEDVTNDRAMNVGQPILASLERVSQPLVIDSQTRQHGRLEVMDMHGILHDVEAEVVEKLATAGRDGEWIKRRHCGGPVPTWWVNSD
jgi:hypothetical protein